MFRIDLWKRKRPRDRAGTACTENGFPDEIKTGHQGKDSSGRTSKMTESDDDDHRFAMHFDEDDAASVPILLTTSSCSVTAPTVSTTDGRQQRLLMSSVTPPRRSRTFANFTISKGRSLFPTKSLRIRRRERLEHRAAKDRMASTRIVALDECIEARWNCGPREGEDDVVAANFALSNTMVHPEQALEAPYEAFPESCCDGDEGDDEGDWDMEDAILFVNNEFTVLEFTTEELGDLPDQEEEETVQSRKQ